MKNMNESQIIIIVGIISARLGIPNIQNIFTEEIITIVSKNPTLANIILISLFKIILVVGSFALLIQLAGNIEFTYDKWYCLKNRPDVFWQYIAWLFATAILTFIVANIWGI